MQKMYLDRLLVKATIAFIAGIIVSYFSGNKTLFVLLLTGVILYWGIQKLSPRILLYSLAFVSGGLLITLTLAQSTTLTAYLDQTITVEGQIINSPINRYYVLLHVDKINGQILKKPLPIIVSKSYQDDSDYPKGAWIEAEGLLQKPASATNPGGYDEAAYWRSQGYFYQLKAADRLLVKTGAKNWLTVIGHLQQQLQQKLAQYLSEEHYALALALLFGEKGAMNEDFYDLSQQMGIAHIFAVSGLHMGFVISLLLVILKLFHWERSWWAIILLSLISFIYCLMLNLTPSSLRAAIMAILTLLSSRWIRYRDAYTVMAIAALVILCLNPLSLFAVGFQLSFITTLGLIYCYPRLWQTLSFLPVPKVRQALAVSLAAQLGSLPLVAYYFYQLSLLAPLVNLLVVPLIGLIVPLLLLSLTAAFIMPLAGDILFLAVEALFDILIIGLDWFTQLWGTGHWYIGRPAWWGLAAYGLFLIIWRQNYLEHLLPNKRRVLTLLAIAIIIAGFLPSKPAANQLTFLDVGQGFSAVAQLTNGDCFVFDGGLKNDVTANYLRYCGINTIDGIILSHPDEDHSNGIAHLLRDFKVRYFFVAESFADDELLQPLLLLAEKQNCQVTFIKDHGALTMNNGDYLALKVFGNYDKNHRNNLQLTAFLDIQGRRAAFPGDLGEKDLLQMATWLKQTDLWAVPHHGSRNSLGENFYQQLSFKGAVISAGKNNFYGHPHQEVLEALESAKIPYWRTDQAGAVTFWWNDSSLNVKTYLQ